MREGAVATGWHAHRKPWHHINKKQGQEQWIKWTWAKFDSNTSHQPAACAPAYSPRISLQHTHQSAAYTSVYSIRISLRHRYQPVAHTSVCSPCISLQHMHHSIASHQPAAYASVYSRTSIYSTHIYLQPAHQFTTYVSYQSASETRISPCGCRLMRML